MPLPSLAVMPSSTTNSAAADAVALMEEAIDAVFALRKSAREADERARQHQEETKVRDDDDGLCENAVLVWVPSRVAT